MNQEPAPRPTSSITITPTGRWVVVGSHLTFQALPRSASKSQLDAHWAEFQRKQALAGAGQAEIREAVREAIRSFSAVGSKASR